MNPKIIWALMTLVLIVNHVSSEPYSDTLYIDNVKRVNLYPDQYKSITTINISSDIMFFVISYDFFEDFSNLKTLSVKDNLLNKLNITVNKLEYLDVSYNSFSDFEDINFAHLPNLISINLAGNTFEEVKFSGDTLPHLISLNLSDNSYMEMVDISSDTLENLSLTNVELTHLILDLPKLKELDFCESSVRRLYGKKLLLQEVCFANSQRDFHISYLDKHGEKDWFNCAYIESAEEVDESMEIEAEVRKGIKSDKFINCNLSTLRHGPNDIVLTQEEYSLLFNTFFTLMALIFVLLLLNCIILRRIMLKLIK